MRQETLPVSAIILVDSEGCFLADAIRSVQSQSHPPEEILIIDANSCDRSVEIALQHPNIRYYHYPNINKATARNLGIQHAKGEAIAFLNAHDLWTSNKLAIQLDHLMTHPTVDIVQGLIHDLSPNATVNLDFITVNPSVLSYQVVQSSSLLYRRSVFEKVGTFDETLDEDEEVDWFLRALELNIEKTELQEITLLRRSWKQPSSPATTASLISLKVMKRRVDRMKARASNRSASSYNADSLSRYIGSPYRKNNVPEFTIISDDCWAAGVYSEVGSPYKTPFIGIRIEAPCYIKLLKELRKYVHSPLAFTKISKYEVRNRWRTKQGLSYPIGLLNEEIELHFMHSDSEAQCREDWQKRVQRINWDNLFIKFRSDFWNFSEEYLTEFDQLPYEFKVCFTQKEYPQFDWAVAAPEYFRALKEVRFFYDESKEYFDAMSWIRKEHGSNPLAYKLKPMVSC